MTLRPLTGIGIVCLAVNLPGPLAAMRLASLGASVTKVEPPTGDPVELVDADWYAKMTAELTVRRLDLKDPDGRAALDGLLDDASVLLTSYRPSALGRVGLGPTDLVARHPHLSHVAIVGDSGTGAEKPGHDLTYQADNGLLPNGQMPPALFADLYGAERAVSEVLAAVAGRALQGQPSVREVSLADGAHELGEPMRRGITGPKGALGGALPVYRVYETRDGRIALAALEPRFQAQLASSLGTELTHAALTAAFAERPTAEWVTWAHDNDIPLAAVR